MKAVNQENLLIIAGPSGAGKTTIYKKLFTEMSGLVFSISVTTRKQRLGEIDGDDYHFIDMNEFLRLKEENAFAEFAQVHGNYYGTLKKELIKKTTQKRLCVLDVDVQGAASLRLLYKKATYIFIAPPSLEILQKRLSQRKTESEATLELRVKNAAKELEDARFFDYVVVNDDFDIAYEKVKQIIQKDRGE